MSRFGTTLVFLGLLLLVGCTPTGGAPTASKTHVEAIERSHEKGPVKLVVRLTPRTPRLSDLVELEIAVTSQANVEIQPPAFGKSVGDFLVRDYTEKFDDKSNAASGSVNKETCRRFYYQLEPVHAGLHLIRSISIEFVDQRPDSESRGEPSSIESDPIEVEITSELGDKVPSLTDLSPMLPPRPLSQSSSWIWLWTALPAAIVAFLLVWFRRQKKANVIQLVSLTPSEIAHRALADLLAENLPAQGRFQDFYVRLTGIVRYYIEGTTGVRAPEQTTEEFLRAMHARDLFQAVQTVRLQDFLEAADMVKYAGQQPNSEQIDVSIARAREFVKMHSPVLIPTHLKSES